jgi:CBS domain-containing protein
VAAVVVWWQTRRCAGGGDLLHGDSGQGIDLARGEPGEDGALTEECGHVLQGHRRQDSTGPRVDDGAPAEAALPHLPRIGVCKLPEFLGLAGGTRVALEEHVMQVRDLMSREVVSIGTMGSCLDAVVRMQRARVRHLPVVNREGLLVGIITDRDLRHYLFSPRMFQALGSTRVDVLLDGVHVAEIMSTDVVTAAPDTNLADAASTMRKEKVGSLPVLENGRVVGILTETDVLRHIVRADAGCAPECAEMIVSHP